MTENHRGGGCDLCVRESRKALWRVGSMSLPAREGHTENKWGLSNSSAVDGLWDVAGGYDLSLRWTLAQQEANAQFPLEEALRWLGQRDLAKKPLNMGPKGQWDVTCGHDLSMRWRGSETWLRSQEERDFFLFYSVKEAKSKIRLFRLPKMEVQI
jgi:hypothetical protein